MVVIETSCEGLEDGGIEKLWAEISAKLKEHGVDLEGACGEPAQVKMVCVAPDLKSSVTELGQSTRDQVVMVRVDASTARDLDSWVETGAVRSRSEAAAVFIREGLSVRRSELDQLRDALSNVEKAKRALREQAQRVFGGDASE